MGFGVSLFLIAVGAILAFAVNTTVSGIEIHTIDGSCSWSASSGSSFR
jgi:Domain of unknown function (DUF6458)